MKSIRGLLLAALFGFAVSCDRTPPPASSSHPLGEETLVSIGGHRIERADLEAELARRARGLPDVFNDGRERERLLEEMIQSEAVYLRAKEAGFDQKPEIAREVKRLIVSQFIEAQLNVPAHSGEITEEAAKEFYQNHPQKFATSEQVRFAIIFLAVPSKATPESKAAIKSKTEQALNEARSLPDSERAFGSIAQRYSEDHATRYARGDAGWVSRDRTGRWNAEVIDAALSLKRAGELAPVIECPNGYYLVKLMDRKEAGRRGFDEVKEAILYQLAQENRQQAQRAFYESMKAGLPIQINRPLLESMTAPTAQKTKPSRVPAG